MAISLQLSILTLVQIFLKKKKKKILQAKKSSFRVETLSKNSLAPGDPRQGESQSYFHNPQHSPAFLPRALKVPVTVSLCTQPELKKRRPGTALVLCIESKDWRNRHPQPSLSAGGFVLPLHNPLEAPEEQSTLSTVSLLEVAGAGCCLAQPSAQSLHLGYAFKKYLLNIK